jgi:hypothetical protein
MKLDNRFLRIAGYIFLYPCDLDLRRMIVYKPEYT